jgi:hypothetical protein
MRSTALVLVVLVLAVAGAAADAETIDNPHYVHWSKFKVGTWVRHKNTSGEGGSAKVSIWTTKLVELTKDKAVLETELREAYGDGWLASKPTRLDVLAKIEKPAPEEPDPESPITRKEGEETLEIAGRKIKCKTVLETIDSVKMKVWSKTWRSDDVPGQVVKSEEKQEKPTAYHGTRVLEDFKAE